jgi:hypothetical protein
MFNTLKQYTSEQYQLALNVLSDVALGRTIMDSQSADMLISYLYHKTLGKETVDKKVAELQDKLSRRNMQIKDLKEKIQAYKTMLQFSHTDYNEKTEAAEKIINR